MLSRIICLTGALACLLVAVIAVGIGIRTPSPAVRSSCTTQAPASVEPSPAQAALVVYNGMQKCLAASVDLHWIAYVESSGQYATAWSYGQVIEGTLGVSMLPDAPSKAAVNKQLQLELHGLSYYFDAGSNPPGYDSSIRAPFGAGSDKFYDDNNWIGIALTQAYEWNHDAHLLKRAEQIFALEEFGARGTQHDACPGGVFWTQTPGDHYRATVSTAGAAQLALRLYLITHDRQYLQFAQTMYNWVYRTLRAPNGLFYDGVQPNGSLVKTQWSYNQGLMLGDGVLLYQSTGNARYLSQAKAIAAASLKFYRTGHRLWAQPPQFNAIYFKNLMLLDMVASNPAYRAFMAYYGTELWHHVNPRTGVFFFRGHSKLLYQAAAEQVFAYLALPLSDVNLA